MIGVWKTPNGICSNHEHRTLNSETNFMLPFSTMNRCTTIIFVSILLIPLQLLAQSMHYDDVPNDAWFKEQISSFLDEGYLDSGQKSFRPGDRASRSEFMKLVVELNGGILDELPTKSSFDDVSPGDWFFGYLEESAREGWVRGDGSCYGSASCTVRPGAPITRAEAAVIVRRGFGKMRLGKAPAFSDNPRGTWFSEEIQAAADHCILRGDDDSRKVRPGDFLNRAEMVVMLFRVDNSGTYPDC